MPDQSPDSDEQLTLKKRARRRLIGAAVFATGAAVILPMVMDREPPAVMPSIELRVPPQDRGFVPPGGKAATPPPAVLPPPVAEPVTPTPAAPTPAATPAPTPTPTAGPQAGAPPGAGESKPALKEAATGSRPAANGDKAEKPPRPETAKAAAGTGSADAKRAQNLLEGQDAKAGNDAPHVVLIGAFANPGNVDTLKKKISELGIRVYTEPLDTPQGKKTRVRAGPFPNRDAAEKAAARMKAIGVGGIVAAKP